MVLEIGIKRYWINSHGRDEKNYKYYLNNTNHIRRVYGAEKTKNEKYVIQVVEMRKEIKYRF